ncbi:MAG: hypothetical protein FJ267_11570, partial [Planctomycetes bacterium]|nr:hypothetical protein [Planctomycetota bacterium]
ESISFVGSFYDSVLSDVTATVGGVVCTVTAVSSSSVICSVGVINAGKGLPFTLRSARYGLAAGVSVVNVKVAVTGFSPSVGSTAGGTRVTVNGVGFGSTPTVSFGAIAATVLSYSTADGSIVVLVPAMGRGSPKIAVSSNGFSRSSSLNFVTNATFTPVYTGSVSGNTFTASFSFMPAGVAQSDISITVGATTCDIQSFSSSEVTCSIGSVAAGDYTILVSVNPFGYGSTASPVLFSVSPTITSFSPTSGSLGGRQSVTIQGSGFSSSAASMSVSLDGKDAEVVSSSETQVVFLTPAVTDEMSSPIVVTVADESSTSTPSVTSAVSYQFLSSLTPVVTSVTPTRGSTAGGTRLTISGSNLDVNQSVSINGIACTQSASEQIATNAASGSRLYCTTSSYQPMMHAAPIVVMTVSNGAASNPSTTYQYIDLWSRWTTWGNSPPPQFGDSAVISEGQVVMIDYSPPRFNLIIVMGMLMFDPTVDVLLECTYIMINYGRFMIGTPEEPYTKQATIRLWGDRLT